MQAIEAAANIAQSTTTIPDILVSNNSFGTIDYQTNKLLATWWKAGQPCMAVDGPIVILIICMGAYKGVWYVVWYLRLIDTSTNHHQNCNRQPQTHAKPITNQGEF